MYAFKRMIAYLIDYVVIMVPVTALTDGLIAWESVYALIAPHTHFMFFGLIPWTLPLAFSAIVLGTLTGLTGWTPAKLLLSLRVRTYRKKPIGVLRGIGRELIKVVALGFFIGMLYALYTLVENGRTFYDEWLECDVPDLSPWGMTKTQKNWRKIMHS